jgi:hypothetical protein
MNPLLEPAQAPPAQPANPLLAALRIPEFKQGLLALLQDPRRAAELGLVKSAVSGATLPGDVYAGRQPMGPPSQTEDLTRVADLAGLAMTGGVAGGPKGALGSGPMRPGKIFSREQPLSSQEGYVYHATNTERAQNIAREGLRTHKAHEFTDQSIWPDGSREKRAYFTPKAEYAPKFAPEEGEGALLRIKAGPDIVLERYTGDMYSKKPIPASRIEVLGEDGNYHPITKFFSDGAAE